MYPPSITSLIPRRDFLLKAGSGFGMLALSSLLNANQSNASESFNSPMDRVEKAKSVIWLFMKMIWSLVHMGVQFGF